MEPKRSGKPGRYFSVLNWASLKWSWFYLYVILDIYSRYVVGWMVAAREAAELAERLLAEAAEVLGGFDEVLGDKGFDSDAIRGTILEEHDALPVIPNRANRTEPWPWDEVMAEWYKDRNRIERAFGKAKQFRRFATRYEKLGEVFLGLVQLVFGFIHVKKMALSGNTP